MQMRRLVGDVDSFIATLKKAGATLDSTRNVPQAVHNGVSYSMKACASLLQHVLSVLEARRTEIVCRGGETAWTVAEVWAALGGDAGVEDVITRLKVHLDFIEIVIKELSWRVTVSAILMHPHPCQRVSRQCGRQPPRGQIDSRHSGFGQS